MAELILPNARPYEFKFPLSRTALLLIDMQRDFLDPDGFGAIQCGDPAIFSFVRKIVPNVQRALEKARAMGMQVIHTREGHRPKLTDLPAAKQMRQISAPKGHHTLAIGDLGPMGRLLVRGEYGHDIIDELAPKQGELVIDKPGKGSFWGTSLHRDLLARGITHLLVGGVTTECCVTTTIRECNDRGYECCLLADCTDGFDAQMVTTAMDTICAQDGLFGYVGDSADFLSQSVEYSPATSIYMPGLSLPSIRELLWQYRSGKEDPVRLINAIYDSIEQHEHRNPGVWICLRNRQDVTTEAEALSANYKNRDLPPLFGIPFGVNDSIDVAGLPTTAACNAYSYTPTASAPAVKSLIDAGGILIGKLNMDQLGTGLSGCRSPYGTLHCVDSADHIAGGSSSGPGVAVGAGLVSFALATDTIGGGLVPAAFNGVVGLKPTRGTISTRGVAPTCPSRDSISIISATVEDARTVWIQLVKHDPDDPFAKPLSSLPTWHVDFRGPRKGGFRFAVPPASVLDSVCSDVYREMFGKAVEKLLASGGNLVEVDYSPFSDAGDIVVSQSGLLVYEHVSAIGVDFLKQNLHSLHPRCQALYQSLLFPGDDVPNPWAIIQDKSRLAELVWRVRRLFDPLEEDSIDVLLVPTTPLHPTVKQMEADPDLESRLGVFTRATNALDLCAVSVNMGRIPESGLPFGVTFIGGMGYDAKILDLASMASLDDQDESRRDSLMAPDKVASCL